MHRSELIRRLVLNAICDDYENVDQVILREVAGNGVKVGLTIARSEIVSALAELVAEGLAKAYLLSSKEPYSAELPGMPSLTVQEDKFTTYFHATKKGIDVQLSGGGL